MTLSSSPRAYDDCIEVLDRAIDDDVGVSVKVDTIEAAIHFKNRLNYARKLDRQHSCQVYDMGHPMFNASQYDGIKISWRNTDNGIFVFLEKYSAIAPQQVQSLSERPRAEIERAVDDTIDTEPAPDRVALAPPVSLTRRPVA